MYILSILAGLIATFAGFHFYSNAKENEEIHTQVSAMNAESHKVASKANSKGLIHGDVETLDTSVNNLANSLESMGGDKAKIGRIINKVIIKQDLLASTLDSDALKQALDFSTLLDLEDYESRTHVIQNYESNNLKLRHYYNENGLLKDIKQFIEEEDLSADTAEPFIKNFATNFSKQLPALMAICDTDNKICKSATQIIHILDENHGKWSWDTEEEIFLLNDEITLKELHTQIQVLQLATKQQSKIQAALFGSN